jgi:hypothetical protein
MQVDLTMPAAPACPATIATSTIDGRRRVRSTGTQGPTSRRSTATERRRVGRHGAVPAVSSRTGCDVVRSSLNCGGATLRRSSHVLNDDATLFVRFRLACNSDCRPSAEATGRVAHLPRPDPLQTHVMTDSNSARADYFKLERIGLISCGHSTNTFAF